MAKKSKANLFIILGLLGIIVLVPLLKAKPPEELGGEVTSTEFERVNGLLR